MVTEYKPAWAAVVVNFDAGRCLVDCVATLLLDTSAGVFEIIVVDNASTDDSISQLRQTWPDVKVILSERNLGYSGAANLGIRATRADV
ncbi:MAG: glycosyltransferase, partial [Actinobacteria bacterium]|nr:glycosyltransferase [Actinomycetota bacterium]